jgi:DUF4097 and DUF4098 domain-containing protein YvlB
MNASKFLMPIMLIAPGVVLAGEPIEERAEMAPDGRVTVINIAGEIDIETWDRNEVELTGDLGDGSELIFEASGGNVRIEVEAEGRSGWGGPDGSDLNLRVPRRADLEVNAVSADVFIDGAGGDSVEVESVSGDIDVRAETDRLELVSVSGDTTFRGAARRSALESVSGDLELEGLSGEIEVSLVSGDVNLDGGEFDLGRFEAVSGTLDLRLAIAPGGRFSAETMSGDVELSLPAGQSGEFRAQTFSGDIRSEFGSPRREKAGPGTRLEHVSGDGDAQIRIESFSGDVRIGSR